MLRKLNNFNIVKFIFLINWQLKKQSHTECFRKYAVERKWKQAIFKKFKT